MSAGRLGIECQAVGDERFGIHPEVLLAFGRSPLRWVVMQRPAEDLAAESRPVASGIGQVKVPGGVYILGWTDGSCSRHGEEDEPFVLTDNALGVDPRPAVLAGEAGRERKRAIRPVDVELEDRVEKFGVV